MSADVNGVPLVRGDLVKLVKDGGIHQDIEGKINLCMDCDVGANFEDEDDE